ncbi:MAG: glycoside hydrolase family 5 protein [Ignavibacteriaceae bacterium]|nr:glycoside hydrolase family 5 protein [Ignavibacteriaceae bacterium]
MRFLLFTFIYFIIIFWAGCDTNPPTYPEPIPEIDQMQNKLLGRGVNIGNALEAPNEGEWGVTIQPDYFEKIASAGFTSVRIPVRWSAHCSPNFPYKIETSFLERIREVIDQALMNRLAVIINMHHFDELYSSPEEERVKFLNLWQQIAEYFSAYDNRLFFEILNEPNGNLTPVKWNTFLADAINTVRVTNPSRTILIGTPEWGGLSSIDELILPAGEKNIIVTVHYYQPFNFTHQGAEWINGSNNWLGIKWSSSAAELSVMEEHFRMASFWAKSQGVALNLGEFGSYRKADIQSRVNWTASVRSFAEKYGMSWHYWEFCAGFGIYDPVTGEYDERLLGALLPPA